MKVSFDDSWQPITAIVSAAGADIIMALDDVVSSVNTTPERQVTHPTHLSWTLAAISVLLIACC